MKIYKPAEEVKYGPVIPVRFPLKQHAVLVALAKCSGADRKDIILDAVETVLKFNTDPAKNPSFVRYLREQHTADMEAEVTAEVLDTLGVKHRGRKQKAAAEGGAT